MLPDVFKKDTFSHTMEGAPDMIALDALNTTRSGFRAKARKLCRCIPRMSLVNLRDTENMFKALEVEIQQFYTNLETWEDLLPVDDQGETIFPELHAFGGGYRLERVEETLDGFKEELLQVKIAFVKFKKTQDLPAQLDIARYSTLSFLQSTDAEAAFRDMIDAEQRDESNLTLGHGDQNAASTSCNEDQIHVE